MTETLEIQIQKQEKDVESGDVYYSVEATIMEPGALFDESEDSDKVTKEKIKEALEDVR